MRKMLNLTLTAGQYFINEQIKEMTRKVSAEVDIVHQQTQTRRYETNQKFLVNKPISQKQTLVCSKLLGKSGCWLPCVQYFIASVHITKLSSRSISYLV